MNVIDNENLRPFDVDGTLIVHKDASIAHAYVYDAVTKKEIRVGVNEAMVRILMEEHHRGGHIWVWSRSGKEWAANVIRALNLVPYVHTVSCKPLVYFDDVPVKKWLKDRVFLGPEVRYKK